MATHFSILAWETPWTEGPGGLQSLGSQRDRHEPATKPQPPPFLVCFFVSPIKYSYKPLQCKDYILSTVLLYHKQNNQHLIDA